MPSADSRKFHAASSNHKFETADSHLQATVLEVWSAMEFIALVVAGRGDFEEHVIRCKRG